jgi:hypothetical protein
MWNCHVFDIDTISIVYRRWQIFRLEKVPIFQFPIDDFEVDGKCHERQSNTKSSESMSQALNSWMRIYADRHSSFWAECTKI